MNDDFDDEVSLDDTFDDFQEDGKTLGSAWRNSPMFKIGAVVGAGAVIFGAITFFSGGDVADTTSYVGEASAVKVAPGTEEASPAYIQALEEQNEADRERAEATGGSALPVPIEPPVGIISVPQDSGDAEDPLQRWRRLQEERLQREIQQREKVGSVSTNDAARRGDAISELAELMQEQMASILESQSGVGISTLNVTSADFLEALRKKKEAEDSDGSEVGEDEFDEEVIQEVIFPAGEIVYAQLLTEANSDAPGPVLAQILTGPLAGNRILGSFEVSNDLLLLNFDTIIIDGENLSIDAVALDPETTLPGMATEVDHRYLQRVLLPAAAAFIEGLSGAIAESGSTNITINSTATTSTDDEDLDTDQEIATGVEEAGAELRGIIDEMAAEVKVMVRIDAGTPVGILFTEPVMTGDDVI